MTKGQQEKTRALGRAMAEYLIEYGWHPVGMGYWTHPKIQGGQLRHTTHDAYMAVRANPILGW